MRRKRQAEDPLDNIEALIHSICNEERREDEVSDETMPETVDLSFDPDIPDPFSNNNDQQISNSEAVSNDAWQSPAPAPVRHSSSSKKRGKVATKNKKKHVTKSNHIDYSSDQDKGSKIQKYKQSGRVTFTAGRAHRKDNHGVPATDVLETSNDEGEDTHFMENMKRLAEEKIQAEKRKSEEHNERMMNNMKQTAIQTEQKMRQIAGDISKEISKSVSRHKKSIPKNIKTDLREIQKIAVVRKETAATLQSELTAFDGNIEKAVSQFISARRDLSQIYSGKEENVLSAVRKTAAEGEKFKNLLSQVQQLLD